MSCDEDARTLLLIISSSVPLFEVSTKRQACHKTMTPFTHLNDVAFIHQRRVHPLPIQQMTSTAAAFCEKASQLQGKFRGNGVAYSHGTQVPYIEELSLVILRKNPKMVVYRLQQDTRHATSDKPMHLEVGVLKILYSDENTYRRHLSSRSRNHASISNGNRDGTRQGDTGYRHKYSHTRVDWVSENSTRMVISTLHRSNESTGVLIKEHRTKQHSPLISGLVSMTRNRRITFIVN